MLDFGKNLNMNIICMYVPSAGVLVNSLSCMILITSPRVCSLLGRCKSLYLDCVELKPPTLLASLPKILPIIMILIFFEYYNIF